jgi:alpha-N-acetylglucosaminidase
MLTRHGHIPWLPPRFVRHAPVLLLWFASAAVALSQDTTIRAGTALIQRLLPTQAPRFVVETIPAVDGRDVFEIETRSNRVVLRGNNGVAVGSALNWYLKYYCHCQMSWCGDNLDLPDPLPVVREKVRRVTPYEHRVDLNYCTFSYSMAWWSWPRWEREIDWMALHGINMPLAVTGQEAVWQEALGQFKVDGGDARSFLSGPAFLAWQWMGNLEGWGGPLTQNWIDGHMDLERQILQRERELGMTPILQGFSGFVPRRLRELFPTARIQQKPPWCAVFEGTAQLDPLDPLSQAFGRAFIRKQTELYGTDHWYAADPFHESKPPDNAPDYLPAVGRTILQTMQSADPQAKIAMQSWSLREPIVRAIAEDHILVLDLASRKWQGSQAFWGRPWVAGVLHNFGGRNFLGGDVPEYLTNAPALLHDPRAGKLAGIGIFPEGIIQNPVVYEAATEIAWWPAPPDVSTWFRNYTTARYGRSDPHAEAAWDLLRKSVYGSAAESGSMESPICARPALKVERAAPNAKMARHYDPRDLWAAWEKLDAAAPALEGRDTFRFDIVDVARQCLADLSIPLQRDVETAYRQTNREALRIASTQFLELADDLDSVLGTRREFLLGAWLEDAKQWATSKFERRQYERNARLLVTVWGPPGTNAMLFDYSNRQWSGLISGFYRPRWKKFLDYLAAQPDEAQRFDDRNLYTSYGRPGDAVSPFYRELSQWERDWCEGRETYPAEPRGDSVEIAHRLLLKWRPVAKEGFKHLEPAAGGKRGQAVLTTDGHG